MKEQLIADSGQRTMGSNDLKELSSDEVKLPASRKIYVGTNGNTANQNRHHLRVPFREIALTPSKEMDGTLEENPPVRIYDTSGPWTDPEQKHDVREGLPALRREISETIAELKPLMTGELGQFGVKLAT